MRRETLVGIFFFAGLAGLAFMTFRVDEESRLFGEERTLYRARFPSAEGLRVGNPAPAGSRR